MRSVFPVLFFALLVLALPHGPLETIAFVLLLFIGIPRLLLIIRDILTR